ncbi:hypothetical protein MHYP_G00070480 [Metynnis hypsauchen]
MQPNERGPLRHAALLDSSRAGFKGGPAMEYWPGAGPDPHHLPLGTSRLMLLGGSIMWLAGRLINRLFPGERCVGRQWVGGVGEYTGETAQPLQQLA